MEEVNNKKKEEIKNLKIKIKKIEGRTIGPAKVPMVQPVTPHPSLSQAAGPAVRHRYDLAVFYSSVAFCSFYFYFLNFF